MTDPLSLGGAGAGGGLLGGLLAWFGFSKRLDRLSDVVQYAKTCEATHKAVDQRLESIEDKLDELLRR